MDMAIDKYQLDSGNSCAIAPGWGCNLFSWIVDGVEMMSVPEGYPEAATKITGGGNPILFPAVGRTWDLSGDQPVQGVYRINGSDKTYFMPSHGIIYLSSFHKVDEQVSADRVSVSYDLTVPDKVREENYPFDVNLTQRFTITPGKVELEGVVTNNGDTPAPVAFGYHPYFRISSPQREGVQVRLPISTYLHTTKDTVLPTGESEPAEGVIDLQPDIYYDHVFAGRIGNRMSLIDPKASHAIHVDFDDTFELFLVYTPNGTNFVCIEPWTRGLGAFGYLNQPGWENGELIPVLKPGETASHRAVFSVEKKEI
ncbi:MAG: hypothetical protein ABFD54_06150 [Armatimonadota bacterium]